MGKRYFVFCIDEYYPAGGMGDCELKTDYILDAIKHVRESNSDYAYVYDVKRDKNIYDSETVERVDEEKDRVEELRKENEREINLAKTVKRNQKWRDRNGV